MASTSSLYEVLGLPMSATCKEIKTAYRSLARVSHPDVVAMSHKETSGKEFMKIHAAYSTLSDPSKRADYDRDLFSAGRGTFHSSFRTAATTSRSPGYTARNWETDQCW